MQRVGQKGEEGDRGQPGPLGLEGTDGTRGVRGPKGVLGQKGNPVSIGSIIQSLSVYTETVCPVETSTKGGFSQKH